VRVVRVVADEHDRNAAITRLDDLLVLGGDHV
jgi:hypothetical protein